MMNFKKNTLALIVVLALGAMTTSSFARDGGGSSGGSQSGNGRSRGADDTPGQ